MESVQEHNAPIELGSATRAAGAPICPVDRLPRKRRNKICIALMMLGAANLLAYPLVYASLGGDAHNGYAETVRQPDGSSRASYFLRGSHLRNLAGQTREVSLGVWVFSYLHSISLLLTSGAMIVSMLVLARPHILATMRDGWISGPKIVTLLGTIVVLATVATAAQFIWAFSVQLSAP